MSHTKPEIEYVPRAAEVVWTAPSAFRNVTLHGFVVKADGALLDEVLNRYIDRPSRELGRRIAVDTPFNRALFIFVESERFQPPPMGSHSEQLFAVVLFGFSRMRSDPAPFLYAPYVYASMMPGWRVEREILGYPQQLANIAITPRHEPGLPAQLEVKASAIEKFGPDVISEPKVILTIDRKPGATEKPVSATELAQAITAAMTTPGTTPDDQSGLAAARQPESGRWARRRWRRRHWRPLTSTAKFGVTAADESFFKRCAREAPEETPGHNLREPEGLLALAGSGEPELGLFKLKEMLGSGAFRMLFLKQFRDVVHADRACYQAIVEADINSSGFKGAFISSDYRLTLSDLDSAPIRRELGVPINPSDVVLAFRVDLGEAKIGSDTTAGTVISNPDWNPAEESSDPDLPSRLPKYVERGGEAVWRQPSLLFGMRICGFGVTVASDKQKAALDRYVNDVARRDRDVVYGRNEFRLSPCLDINMVMLMFVEYSQVTSGTDDDRRLGGVSYREFLAMQLAFCDDENFPELDWFIPFIYLDKDSPRLGGREIFGYPKQLGTIPPFLRFVEGGAARRLELTATVLPNASADRAQESQPIVTIEALTAPTIERQYDKAEDMIADLLTPGPPSIQSGTRPGRLFPIGAPPVAGGNGPGLPGAGVDIVNALVSGGVGHVCLKQFRDCERPDAPCYQAVCKLDTAPGRFHGGARLSAKDYLITINELESEPLIKYLGGSAHTWQDGVRPHFAYVMDLDAELTTGRVIANPFEGPFAPDRSPVNIVERRDRRRIRRSREPAF